MIVRDRIFAKGEKLVKFQQRQARASPDLPNGFLFVKVGDC